MGQVAEILATVTDRDTRHINVSRQAWAEHGVALGCLARRQRDSVDL